MTSRYLLDVNVLLALSWAGHVHHERAHEHFAQVTYWSTTPVTENGLLRLLMTEAVVGRPIGGLDAMSQLQAIRSAERWSWIPDDISPTTWNVAADRLRGRRQVTDLHLVNLAAANDVVLATFDGSIRRSLPPNARRHVEVWD